MADPLSAVHGEPPPSPEPPLLVRVTNAGFEPRHVRVAEGRLVKFVVGGTLSHMLTGPGLITRQKIELTEDSPAIRFDREDAAPFRPSAVIAGGGDTSAPERGHLKLVVDNG